MEGSLEDVESEIDTVSLIKPFEYYFRIFCYLSFLKFAYIDIIFPVRARRFNVYTTSIQRPYRLNVKMTLCTYLVSYKVLQTAFKMIYSTSLTYVIYLGLVRTQRQFNVYTSSITSWWRRLKLFIVYLELWPTILFQIEMNLPQTDPGVSAQRLDQIGKALMVCYNNYNDILK